MLVPVDRVVATLTGGRVVAMRLAPALLLVTTGRRSGQTRTTPLLYAPDGDGFLVVGSNWGGPRHPGWALNLRAEPYATVTVNGVTTPVTARLLHGAEREDAWQRLVRIWPAYQTYARRAGRALYVFRLERRAG